MNLEERGINAVGKITNPWSEPRPKPQQIAEEQAWIAHLVGAACRGAESLEYLVALDEQRFGGTRIVDQFRNATVDDAQVRWAVATSVSALDQCTAAAARLGRIRKPQATNEPSVRTFYRTDGPNAVDNRSQLQHLGGVGWTTLCLIYGTNASYSRETHSCTLPFGKESRAGQTKSRDTTADTSTW